MHAGENPAGSGRRLWIPLFAALALVLASNLPGASGDARAATVDECSTAFNGSPASSDGCQLRETTGGSDCTFVAQCKYIEADGGGGSRTSSISVSLADADDLENCSGTLALSC